MRTNNLFTIIACDAAGVRRPTGGDEFEVRIHAGGVKLRCGVTDNGDGSYTVSYNPELSGEYSIDVTLSGEHLPGSPYTCYAHTRTAHPPLCSISGDALVSAISREQQSVEVRFRDALGNAAHAEDIDCFAEPVEDFLASTIAAEEELDLPQWLRAGQPASPRVASPRPAAADQVNCAKCKVPLVVRADLSTESERICQLRKGRLLYVLEEKKVGDKTPPDVRALIAVDDEPDGSGEEEGSWRSAFKGNPADPASGGESSTSAAPSNPSTWR